MPSTVPTSGAAGDSTDHSTTSVDLLNPERWSEPTGVTHLVQALDPDTGEAIEGFPARSQAEADKLVALWEGLGYPVRTLRRCRWYATCDRVATSVISHPVIGDVAACDRCQGLAGVR